MWSIIPKKQNDNSFFFYEDDRNKTSFFKKKKKMSVAKTMDAHTEHCSNISIKCFYLFILPYQLCQHNWLGATDWEPKTGKGEEESFSLESRIQMSTGKAIPKITICWNSEPVKDNRSYEMLCIITSKFASYQKNTLLRK